MTDDERRLADLLHNATPRPPRTLDADELMRGERRSRRLRYWPQLAAAAVVVVLAGAIAAVAGNNVSHGPRAGAPLRSGTLQHSADECTQLGEVSSRTVSVEGGDRLLQFGFFNTGRTSCFIRSLVVELNPARSGRSENVTLRQNRKIRLRPGDTVTTNLTWSTHSGWTTRRYTSIKLLSPRGNSVTPTSAIVAPVYPKGSSHAGQLAVSLMPLRHNPALTPIPQRGLGLNIYPSATGPLPKQYKDCVLGMQPSLGKVTANGTRRSVTLYFRNISGKPCATYAAPGLLATPTHSRNGIMVDLVNSGFRQGVLQPGKRAYSTLTWTDDPKRPTARYTTLQVLNPIVHYAKEIDLPISYEISDHRMVCTGLRPVGS